MGAKGQPESVAAGNTLMLLTKGSTAQGGSTGSFAHPSILVLAVFPGPAQKASQRTTHFQHRCHCPNVLHALISPLVKPRWNQSMRCCELPCVYVSGFTRPDDMRCKRSSPTAPAAFRPS